jgi:hypothetical protein
MAYVSGPTKVVGKNYTLQGEVCTLSLSFSCILRHMSEVVPFYN